MQDPIETEAIRRLSSQLEDTGASLEMLRKATDRAREATDAFAQVTGDHQRSSAKELPGPRPPGRNRAERRAAMRRKEPAHS